MRERATKRSASRKTMTKLHHFDLKDLAGVDRRLEIGAGDVLDSGAGFADLLVISAFPWNYIPTPTSRTFAAGHFESENPSKRGVLRSKVCNTSGLARATGRLVAS